MSPRPALFLLRTLLAAVALPAPAGAAPGSPASPAAPAPLPAKLQRARAAYRALLAKHGLPDPPPGVRFEVDKADRRLRLYAGGKLLVDTRCGLGGAPVGNKVREGDQKTPEGTYYVCTRNERSLFHLFLGISYPDRPDAARGLADGLIGRAQYRRILDAVRRKAPVPWNTALGGAIGIHGHGGGSDWTLGCVAVEDDEIETLWYFGRIGTPVEIRP